MHDLAELERRINAALQRIGDGIEAANTPQGAMPQDASPQGAMQGATQDEILRLREELAAERRQTDALRAQLQTLSATAPAPATEPAAEPTAPPVTTDDSARRIEALTRQVDVQTLEMQRMRKNVVQLRENLRALRRAAADKLPDPEMINRAMMAELESIRVTRFAEIAELDGIIAELDPLLAEVSEHA